MVGGKVFLPDAVPSGRNVRRLKDGDRVPGHIFADGVLVRVESEKHLDGYTVYVGKAKGKNVVTDGTRYSCCDKIRDGVADLLFKSVEGRGAGQYKGLPLDTEMTVDAAKAMYRVITGICRKWAEVIFEGLGDAREGRCSIREVLELTKGQVGSESFEEFFGAVKA